jgi:hypothetical protein
MLEATVQRLRPTLKWLFLNYLLSLGTVMCLRRSYP